LRIHIYFTLKPAHISFKALILPNCIVIITKIIRSLDALSLPRQLSTSQNNSPPRMTSLRFARGDSASHEESPSRTRSLRFARGDSASHEESPPRLRQLCSYEKFPPPTMGDPTHGGSERGNQGPHECGVALTLGLPHGDTQRTSFPRHANAPVDGTRRWPTLTRAVMRHFSAARPPTHRPVMK
jgi:hypothetical protein